MPVKLSLMITAMTIAALSAPDSVALAKALQSNSAHDCIAKDAKATDFSGVISVGRPGGGVTYAQGQIAGPDSAAIRADTQFNLGSATKMWTAVAVAQLADAKKIALDDPIGRHVKGLTPEASAATIKQLLTHTGGLGNFFMPENLAAIKRARSLSDLKPLVLAEKPQFPPGQGAQYSNSGFLLLGLMIEEVSGQSYADYLQAHIFAPAGMTGSSVQPAASAIRAVGMTNLPPMDMAEGAARMPPGSPPGARMGPPPGANVGGPMRPPPGPLRPSDEGALMGNSAGGTYSTAADMQAFFSALFAGKLTSKAMRDALTSQQVTMLPARGGMPALYYGMGFGVGDYQGRAWAGHNGGAPGVNVTMMAFPKDQTTIVVMTNRDPPGADMMLGKIRSTVFDGGLCGAG